MTRLSLATILACLLLAGTVITTSAAERETVQDGNWTGATTNPWKDGIVPNDTDVAIIKHNVNLDPTSLTKVKALTIQSTGRLYTVTGYAQEFIVTQDLKNDGRLIFPGTTTYPSICTLRVLGGFVNGDPLVSPPTAQCTITNYRLAVSGAMYNKGTFVRNPDPNTRTSVIIRGGLTNEGTAPNGIYRQVYGPHEWTISGGFTNKGDYINQSGGVPLIVLTGDFTNSGTYAAIGSGGSMTVSAGDFLNNGTFTNTGTGYIPSLTVSTGNFTNSGSFTQTSHGTLTVAGYATNSSTGTITRGTTSTGAWNFSGRFTNEGTYTATAAASPLTVNGDFSNAGTATFDNSGNGNLTFNGEFTHNSTTAPTWGIGTITFGGSTNTLLSSSVAPLFKTMVVNKTAGDKSLTLGCNLRVTHVLTVTAGGLALHGNQLTLGATGVSCVAAVNGGTFSAVGSDRDVRAVVTAADLTYPYSFTVRSGATMAASRATFGGMDSTGIVVDGGATIDPVNNFSDCSFDHDSTAGPMLRIENNQTLTMTNVDFSGSAGFNIQKTLAASGRIEVGAGGGTRWGEDYDNDPNNLIDWGAPAVEEQPGLPARFAVSKAAPNPLKSAAQVRYALPRSEFVQAGLYDACGRLVLVVAEGEMKAGFHQLRIDAGEMAEGVYLLRFRAGASQTCQKLVVQRKNSGN